MRFRTLSAGLLGVAALAGMTVATAGSASAVPAVPHVAAAKIPKPVQHKLPYCPPQSKIRYDICFVNMQVAEHRHGTVEALIRVKTVTLPRAFELYAALDLRVGAKWETQESHTYKRADLAAPGHEKDMLPSLEAYCKKAGRIEFWQLDLHLISISSSGLHQSTFYSFPGNGRKVHDTFLERRTYPFKNRWGVRIRCN